MDQPREREIAMKGKGNILCVDLGKKTGVCIWPADDRKLDEAIHIRPVQVVGKEDRDLFSSFRGLIKRLMTEFYPVVRIIYEEPHHQGGPATRHLVGYRAILHLESYTWSIPIHGVHTGTLKKVVAGYGKAKKPDMKIAVMDRIGWYPDIENKTDDEIDAAALGIWWERVGRRMSDDC
jgi:Holliday junction resolvasome RuvABC endonuclease subunit